MASIFLLKALTVDWSHLTDLTIANTCISDCLAVLRSAPRLTHCALNPRFHPANLTHPAHYQLPAEPIVHPSLVDLTLTGPHFPALLGYLVCPSLRTLQVRRIFGVQRAESLRPMPEGWMERVIAFVRLSGCPVTDFSVVGFEQSTEIIVIASLCHGMPALHHLYAEWAEDDLGLPAHDHLFALILATTTSRGKMEPLCLPDLRSLTVHSNSEIGLESLLPRAARLRSTLDVCISLGQEGVEASEVIIKEETREQLRSLQNQGVKLKLLVGKDKKEVI